MHALLLLAVLIAPPTPKFVGDYRMATFDKAGKDMDAKNPTGAIRVLTLRKDQTWIVRDMMSGFEGTWSAKGRVLTLKILQGPSRIPPKGAFVLRVDSNGKDLLMGQPSEPGYKTVFIYDPQIQKRLSKEAEALFKKYKGGRH